MNILDFKPQSNYRMPPLQIAALKKRIQRPSYVPADQDGNRLPYPLQRSKLVSVTTSKSSESVKFSDEPLLSPSDLLTPNAASLTSSNGFLSNQDGRVLTSDLSKILLKNSRLHSSLDHINRATPGSPGPVTRPRSRTLPQSEVLPPVCITSDYHSRNNTPDIPEQEQAEIASPRQEDGAVFVTLDDFPSGNEKEVMQTRRKSRRRNKSDTEIHTDITKLADVGMKLSPTPRAGSKETYVRVCHTLDIPVSQSIYRAFSTGNMNLRYHSLSQLQVKALAITLTKNSTVKSLNLSSTSLTDESFSYICDVLSVNQTLTGLYAADNKLSAVSAKKLLVSLEHNRCLEVLDLSGNLFKDTDATYFAEIINNTNVLKRLVLNSNMFGEQAGFILGRVLGCNNTLTSLELNWNQLRKDSASQLIKMMRVNCTLRELDLSWNGLGEEGCESLAEFLRVNRTLRKLDITSNRIRQQAFRQLAKGLTKNKALHELKVGKNPITSNGILEFLAKLKCLRMSKISALAELKSIDFQDIAVGREVIKICNSIKKDYPHLELAFSSVSSEPLATSSTKKQDYTKLNLRQAKTLLFEALKSSGLDPDFLLPRNENIIWDLFEFKNALQAMSISLTDGAIDLILRKVAMDGAVKPSAILARDPPKRRGHSHVHQH